MTDTYCLEDALARLSNRQRVKIEELIHQRALLIAALREIEQGAGYTVMAVRQLAKDALENL